MLKKIIKFLSVVLILLAGLYFLLLVGIKVNSFSVLNFNVSKFYLKLDKKLILNVEKISFNKKNTKLKNSFYEIKQNIDLLPKILSLFQEIKINNLAINKEVYKILLLKDKIYIEDDKLKLITDLNLNGKTFILNIKELILKDFQLNFKGKVKLEYFKEKFHYYGDFIYKNKMNGKLILEANKDKIKFYFNAKDFTNIKFLKKMISLNKIAEEWMYDNVKGDMNLKYLYGEYDLNKNIILEKTLSGKAIINNATIQFNKKVKPAHAEKLFINYDNNDLKFNFQNVKYGKKNLLGSEVVIQNLTDPDKGIVDVVLKTKSSLDKDVLDILTAYDINLPLKQKKGIVEAKLYLGFPYSENKKMIVRGNFKTENSSFMIDKFLFNTDKANVILDGMDIKIIDSNFKYQKIINSKVNIVLNAETLKAKGDVLINKIFIKAKDMDILNLTNKKSKIKLDFNNDVNIELEDLFVKVDVLKDINVTINNLAILYPYSGLLKKYNLKDGNAKINFSNENFLNFDAKINNLNYPIYRNGKKLTSLSVEGKIRKNFLKIKTHDGSMSFDQGNNSTPIVKLKDIEIKLKTEKDIKKTFPKLILEMNKIKLFLNSNVYNIEKANLEFFKEKVLFNGEVKNINFLPLKKNNKIVHNLTLNGTFNKNEISIKANNNSIIFWANKDSVKIKLKNYLFLYNTGVETEVKKYKKFFIQAENTNILLNNKYKILSDKFELNMENENIFFNLEHSDSAKITYKKTKNNEVDIYANDISDLFINTLYDGNFVEGGKIMLHAGGTTKMVEGNVVFQHVEIKDLTLLNNILLFIQTSPALINPLLAIPSVINTATNEGGIKLNTYFINKGNVDFSYNEEKDMLKIDKLITKGNGIDFDGNGVVNLKNRSIESEIKLAFFKGYSEIVGMIPVVNYVLLGDSNKIESTIKIEGTLDDPKITTNLTKEAFSVPANILKRIILSPVKLFDFLNKNQDKNKDKIKEDSVEN